MLFAFRINYRPAETNGTIAILFGSAASGAGTGLIENWTEMCKKRIETVNVKEDKRELPTSSQGPAPRAPSHHARPRRGPWG